MKPARAPYSTGVIVALPVNHRVGLSLESSILKIRSLVNDHCSLWGRLLSSMIRLHMNVHVSNVLGGRRGVHTLEREGGDTHHPYHPMSHPWFAASDGCNCDPLASSYHHADWTNLQNMLIVKEGVPGWSSSSSLPPNPLPVEWGDRRWMSGLAWT